ncbi:Scr1 family TA system antitoxin-like transcriptional regulator [Streptomyces uncialis]|uniref:helix-turn-helix domain-containing protein n=1 Tax=Streptomyces uncialis TaxID=1048205 RepID=UPI00224CAAA8|nr:helix-turn-helix transcriptional regulator [Streptomyces uncialis]MCX4664774.1 helix-turn-helix domain-containing protein [Streptomyces uncialis]
MSQRDATGESTEAATTAGVFGDVLRHFRRSADLTQDGLAGQIPCDRSLVARVEAGTRVPQDSFVRRCDAVLTTGGVLIQLWGRIDWYPAVEHPDWFQRRADMDAVTIDLREYQTYVVPGLLQTEDYARAILSYAHSGDALEDRLRARLSRQPRFLAPNGPMYHAILDESCLRNVVGSRSVMQGQLAHLLSVGQLPNIRLQVAPADLVGLERPDVSMSLLKLPDGAEWAYSESLDQGHFINEPTVYARHSRTYDVLRADTLSAPMSASWISEALEGFGPHGEAPSQRGEVDQEQLQRRKRRQLHRSSFRHPRLRPDR